MRLRNKKWTKDFIELNKNLFIDENIEFSNYKLLKKFKKTILEIGCGKGKYISTCASMNSNNFYIALEKETTVIGVAAKTALEVFENKTIENLLFINTYAEKLNNIFKNETFDEIHLNFSDPWPKSKGFKKRLTYTTFLQMYAKLLKKNGLLKIKTDNDQLYNFSIDELNASEFEITRMTSDLYSEKDLLKNNVQTEYEKKFHEAGKNINLIIASIQK